MDRFELQDILDKAQIKYNLKFSHIYGSEYWTINGLYYRVSDHDKPKNNEQGYIKGVNDFRSHDDLYEKLKERKDLDISDKTDKEAEFKSNLEDYVFEREDGIWEYDAHVYPILNSSKEGLLGYIWNAKEVLEFEKKVKELIATDEKGLFVTPDGRKFNKIEWALKYLWDEKYDESIVPKEYIKNQYKNGGYMEKNKGVITGEFKDARYAKDKILYIPPSGSGFTKNRESRLAEAVGVNGKYTHREKGYIMSKKQAERLKEHLIKGHDAEFISGEIIENTDEYAKGGIVVTKIKDIPNFQKRLEEGKITYRGLGLGKVFDDFYKVAGTTGYRIKVDGKEYYITEEEFNTFSRDENGKMRIRFDAPYRRSYAKGGKTKSTFEEKVKAIAKRLEGEKVPKKYKKEYGATYDKAESKQAGRRIAGSQLVKLKEKMEKMRKAKKKS